MLTSEDLKKVRSVLTSDRRERADKPPKAACCKRKSPGRLLGVIGGERERRSRAPGSLIVSV